MEIMAGRPPRWFNYIALWLNFILWGISLMAEEPRVVTVGAYSNPPNIFQDKDGEITGFFPEVLEAIGKKEGWTLHYKCGTGESLVAEARKGGVDLLPVIAYSPERDLFLDFNQETVITNWATVYVNGSTKRLFASPHDLDGMTMAAVEGSIQLDAHLALMKTDPDSTYFQAHERWVDPLLHPEKKLLWVSPWILGTVTLLIVLLILFRWQLGRRTKELKRQVAEASRLTEDLEESRRQLVIASEAGSIGFWSWNVENEDVVINEEYANLLGYELRELEPISFQTWQDLCHKEDLEPTRELLRKCLQGERHSFQAEIRMRHKEGHWVWILSRGRVLERQPDGLARRILGSHSDITFIKKTQESLRKYEFVLEKIPHPIWGGDLPGPQFYANAAAKAELGISREAMEKFSWEAIIHPEDHDFARRQWEMHAANKEPYDIELRLFSTKARSYRWYLISHQPMLDDKKKVEQWVSIATDIHSFMTSQKRLILARDKAEAANKAKSEFLAVMNHELRTPLNSILAPARILRDKTEDAEQINLLSLIEESANHLLEVINDILSYSKAEQGFLKAKPESVDLRELIPRRLGPLKREAENKSLDFQIQISPKVPRFLHLDPRMLTQILINLVGNALKFTAEGSIELSVRFQDAHNSRTPREMLEILVKDTGGGIEKPFHQTIFEPFQQTDMSLRREHEGTGLGLAISRQMATVMGGALELHSSTPQGSVFRLFVPVGYASGEDSSSQSSLSSLKAELKDFFRKYPCSLLIVDDDSANIQILALLLKQFGLKGKSALSGEEALERYAEQSFDLMFMDIQLPGMDGFEATAAIRCRHKGNPPYTIAITAYTDLEDERYRETRFEDYINKPITMENLGLALRRFQINHQKSSAPPSGT